MTNPHHSSVIPVCLLWLVCFTAITTTATTHAFLWNTQQCWTSKASFVRLPATKTNVHATTTTNSTATTTISSTTRAARSRSSSTGRKRKLQELSPPATSPALTTTKKKQGNANDHPTKESKWLSGLKPTIKVDKVWHIYMEELIKHNQTHGHINVPEVSKEYPQLAKFVGNIRRTQSRLTMEQRDMLDNYGFIWKDAHRVKHQQRWVEMFERLQQYKHEFGDCKVPQNYTGGQKPSLGNWVRKNRQGYKDRTLEKERIDMLNSIGFVWKLKGGVRKPNDKLWEKHFQELLDFKLQFSHTNVPQKSQKNKSLAAWVNKQRSLFFSKTLLDDRKQKLEEIGFIWNFQKIRDNAWQVQFEKLKLYIEKYGKDSPILQDLELSDWASQQRLYKEKGRLDKRRKAKLDKIGFNWDPKRTLNRLDDFARNNTESPSRNS